MAAGQQIRIRLKGLRPPRVGQVFHRDCGDREAYRQPRGWPDSAAHPPRALHHDPFAAREQEEPETFEQRTHKRLIDILQPTPATVDELKKLNLPAGVDINIKIF